jgi:predicted TIM-barrel fold metal-dependent hydrolase
LRIYVVNNKGQLEKSLAPIIDGSLNGPDGVFQLIYDYLRAINIEQADKVLFVADGAHWIWNRIPKLIKNLGLQSDQIHELLDFYHAVEHISSVASLSTIF